MIKIGLSGAGGRMGRRIAAMAIEGEQYDIIAAVEAPGSPCLGKDMGDLAGCGPFGLKVAHSTSEKPDVWIDFSLPDSTVIWLEHCRGLGVPMVIGTTGMTESQQAAVSDAARAIPVVHAPNMSVGVNVLLKLVADAAKILGGDYDIEVAETHHRMKKDAPSGTAIALAKSVCSATGKNYGEVAVFGRGGQHPRRAGEIGMHALRLGDTIGEHTVYFGNMGETVTLGHSAHNRDTFAQGALRAARWLVGRPAGLYTMQDVLFGGK
ncbi:MAG: 4-hydroxy-tetrahydrodipicolinate reductase [Planctomycetes bacterium]|nr:4-hydroxy-tetrahydrodipicolinate reductase [Planctomycetota bacterium]